MANFQSSHAAAAAGAGSLIFQQPHHFVPFDLSRQDLRQASGRAGGIAEQREGTKEIMPNVDKYGVGREINFGHG
jgi:hypothetical protein